MRIGSLFTGIGGFDLAFERAGCEVAWQCEFNPHARNVLAAHWPDVTCYHDVREVSDVPAVDVVCGGFPCQDLSVAGRRAGLVGERSGLWFEFHRVLERARPRWVVIENVPGLRSSNGGRDLAVVLRGLAELGYLGSYRSLDAQYAGLAQRRERVFIVGHLGDGRAAEVLFEREGLCWDPPARGAAREGVAAPLGGSAQSGGYRTTDLDHGAIVLPTLTASLGHHGYSSPRGDGSDPIIIADPLTANNRYCAAGNNPRPVNIVVDVQQATSRDNRVQPTEGFAPPLTPGGQLISVWPSVTDTLSAAGPGGHFGAGGNTHPQNIIAVARLEVVPRPRRLTPTECERLQGFPDGWTAGQADSHRYRQLGNAVAVPVAEWIARRIAAVGGEVEC